MRLTPSLLAAAFLATNVKAFYPFEFQLEKESSETDVEDLERRFFPWKLEDDDGGTTTDSSTTLELKRVPGPVGSSVLFLRSLNMKKRPTPRISF